jgi:acetoin utilization protein AcuB
MKVSQYMSRSVVTIAPQAEFHWAFDLMRSRRIHHLPVVEDDRVVGIVAERDLLLAAANFGSAEVPVREIMHSPAICVSENAQLKQAARLLVVEHIGSLPVLNARKALVGIITETDIFKVTAGMLRARPAAKKAVKKTVKKAATKTAKKTATKTAKRASKRTAQKVTRKSAKKAVRKTAK